MFGKTSKPTTPLHSERCCWLFLPFWEVRWGCYFFTTL